MKIEYNVICTNVLKDCPIPCKRCAFFPMSVCPPGGPISNYMSCRLCGFEKNPGYIFKV